MITQTDIDDMSDAQDEATTPARIWLLPGAGNEGETLWCDQPAPGADMLEEDAVEYVRADLASPSQAGDERVARLVKEYRPSMDAEVLHSWAQYVVAALAAMDTPKGVGDA